jgi:uncharacterized protein YjdB
MRLRRRSLLPLSCVALLVACGGESTSPATGVESISVTLTSTQLLVGKSTTATATLRDSKGGTLAGRAVVWSSSATSVATVTGDGAVTALAPGSATISASSEGRSGNATLVVSQRPVSTMSVSVASARLLPGATA